MASDSDPDVEAPDGYDIGGIDDAIVDEDDTHIVWITDDDTNTAYWFEVMNDVPLRKKNEALENNLTTTQGPDGQPQQNLSNGYYTDLLNYMVVDWFGANESNGEVPSLRVFLEKMSSVFEELQDEVPSPFGTVDEDEAGK